MATKGMSDKERALLQAARREVGAKANRREVVDTAAVAGSSSHRGSAAARTRREPPPVSPLDAQTVLGWDHPAAQKPASAAEDKWARLAHLMEAERLEAAAKRARARRNTIIFLVCLFAVVLIAGTRALIR